MFREWRVDVSGRLRKEGNVLRVYFHSPIKVDLPKWEALPYRYEAGNDSRKTAGCLKKR